MKRILWITNGWIYDKTGGRTIASKRIMKHLSQNGYNISILDFEVRIKQPLNLKQRYIFYSNVNIYHLFLRSDKRVMWETFRFALSQRFDYIICSGFAYIDLLSFIAIKLMGFLKHVPIVLFEHTNPKESIKLSWFRYIYQILAQFLYKRFDYIITPSHGVKKIFEEAYRVPHKKIQVIHYPVITKNIDTYKRKSIEQALLTKDIRIITIARYDLYQKDYETLFQAFKNIKTKIAGVTLWILGTGRDKLKVKKISQRLSIYNNVRFIGYRRNPWRYLGKADIFVLSSRYEGAPLVLVEAMACGVPIVSSDCETGPREILQDGRCGTLVPVGDAQAMAKAILDVLTDTKKREKYVRNGLKRAQDFREEDALKKWERFINTIEPLRN